ncbi:SDR family NAD(P)-dependent oxidoreductase [Paraburkholderia fynbosensis]|uniref:3-oxoacyl-[acyl-carrier-protein] reductase FabG n=1 Tax=Paraburkholderia fynbosensis TaxID=1200993 RepID=A0A6J5H0V2_9BURK|nr:SDR family oxidoreductase [Paraburkholderia fynbosensis]CAB3807054.1 3-oxoacyl-[acyl-carrier-protein] reductase FabG [Paraburkholderia fynbosensis]
MSESVTTSEIHLAKPHPQGSVVVVTGAGSGIGQATAVLAARRGYRVAAWDLNPDGIQKTIEAAGGFGASITAVSGDVTNSSAIDAAMKKSAELGPLVGLVNNAGPVAIGRDPQFADTVKDAIGSVEMVTAAFMQSNPAEGAAVVNIASVVGPIFGGGAAWYCAAKAGIVGYTKYMAATHGGRVRFNCVAPGGPVRTPRNSKFIDEGVFSKHLEKNPMRRPGRPDELASGIVFLLTPAASYINGVLLPIDGGLSIVE